MAVNGDLVGPGFTGVGERPGRTSGLQRDYWFVLFADRNRPCVRRLRYVFQEVVGNRPASRHLVLHVAGSDREISHSTLFVSGGGLLCPLIQHRPEHIEYLLHDDHVAFLGWMNPVSLIQRG